MALTIYKIVESVRWRAGTTILRLTSGSGIYVEPTNLSNYYTKTELNVDGGSTIHFGNIIEAYHNNLLDIQGGLDTSSGDSSGYDAEYYHLDASTYYDITGIAFQMSIVKDSVNAVTLVNDEDTPGNSQYYGTNGAGTKGWYDLPTAGSTQDSSGLAYVSAYGTPLNNQIAIWVDEDTIEGSTDLSYDGRTFVFGGYPIDVPDVAKTMLSIGTILTAYSTAEYDLFIGIGAGAAAATDGWNIAIGADAFATSTGGAANIAIGYQSLYSNQGDFVSSDGGGNYNIGIGATSLYENTLGNGNVGIGYETLKANTTGDYNTAVGWVALSQVEGGVGNVGIGYNAGAIIIFGSNNVAIGSQAYGPYTGDETVSIGYLAGPGGSSVDNINGTIGIGTRAGRNYLGVGNTPLLISTDSIYIGRDTLALENGTINEIVIGYAAIGHGSDTTTIGNIDTVATYLAGEIYVVTYDSSGGSDAVGSLPLADSSITQIVMYDPDTGKLYYGAGTGGDVTYTFGMSLAESAGTVTLDNDEASPGNSKYYGTDAGGTKGWYALPEGSSGGGVDGSGANTRVAFWTDADTLSSDSQFIWDGTNLNLTSTDAVSELSMSYDGFFMTDNVSDSNATACMLAPGRGAVTGVDWAYLFDTYSTLGEYKLAQFRINNVTKAYIDTAGFSATNNRGTNFIWRYIIGDAALVSHDAEASTAANAYTKLKTITLDANVGHNMTLRITFDLKYSTTGPPYAYGRIYRNGVAIGTERSTSSAAYQTYSEDIAGWYAGDTIELYVYAHTTGTAYVQNFRVCGSHNSTMVNEVSGSNS